MRKTLSKIAGAVAIALILPAMASAEPMWEKKEGSMDPWKGGFWPGPKIAMLVSQL